MEPYKIILVDDHSLFRNGLRGLLERRAACRVVGEAASGEEFLAMLGGVDADVVFMDFAMPGLDGAQTTERALAQRPDLKIITLSMFGEESYYSRMVEAGARGFLLKDSDIGDVIDEVCTIGSSPTSTAVPNTARAPAKLVAWTSASRRGSVATMAAQWRTASHPFIAARIASVSAMRATT